MATNEPKQNISEIGSVRPREITEEMKGSYIDYAMSVIVARALPDVRDGLKPVHRRILYAMHEDGLTHGARFRKSATVVGSTLGRYHPHGDMAVYDALVRMAQDFSMRYPLIDGQGNFGCFTKDTKVQLTDGRTLSFVKLIQEQNQGKRHWTFSFNEKKKKIEVAEIKRPRLTRKKAELVEIILDNGEKIRCTPDHRFMLRSGVYCEAENLTPGTSLMPLYTKLHDGMGDKNAKGYRLILQPFTRIWEFAHHLADQWNLKKEVYAKNTGRIRHHVDFQKLNNNPDNIRRMQWAEHWKLHYEMASWRHKNDPEYVRKLAEGRKQFIEQNRELLSERASKRNQEAWKNPEYRIKKITAIQALWRNPVYKEYMRKAASANLKRLWSMKNFQALLSRLKSEEMKERWKNADYHKTMAAHTRKWSKKIWADPKHRAFISRRMKEEMERPERKEYQRKISQSLWKNSEYRAHYSQDHFRDMARTLWDNPQTRILHREKILKQWQDPEFIKKNQERLKTFAQRRADAKLHNHKVLRVARLQKREDVYDITIDPWHNFALAAGVFVHNSIDGDPAAAQRYSEARMSRIGEEMLRDIEKETVDFTDNYDGTRKEPTVLPSPLPQLLLNGTLGIAVGMATSVPPHNLSELVDAITHLIDHPKTTSEDLFQFVKGPDFPTGGIIYNKQDIITAYSQGKGPITMRGKAEVVEDEKSKKTQIVITEIPYQVNKSTLVEQFANLVQEKKIEGVRDIRDESDKDGLRVTFDLQRDSHPQKILNRLYKFSDLQKTFHLNMIALVDGIQPKVLSLSEMLLYFIEHRRQVIYRRTKFELGKAKDREHILEGLQKCLSHIDEVIRIIRNSANREEAQQNLMKRFRLTDIQANAILETKLAQLAKLERKKIEDELALIRARIKELADLLGSPKKIDEAIKKELLEAKQTFGDARRTKVQMQAVGEIAEEDLIPQEETIITVTQGGYIKRINPATYKIQRRGGKGIMGMKTVSDDIVEHFLFCQTHDNLMIFTDSGKVFQVPSYEIPEGTRVAKGRGLLNFVEIAPQDKVLSIFPIGKQDAEAGINYLVMVTRDGIIKKSSLEDFKNVRKSGIIAISLKKGDILKGVAKTTGEDEIILVSKKGQSIRFKEKDVRPMGRSASGIRGIRLKKKDEVAAMDVLSKNQLQGETKSRLFVLMENGYGKRTDVKEYKAQTRGGSGIKTANITPKTGEMVFAKVLAGDEEELIVISRKAQVIRTAIESIPNISRSTQGVRIMRLEDGDKVVSAACM